MFTESSHQTLWKNKIENLHDNELEHYNLYKFITKRE
ncbi:hypothetical protein CPAV1605_367 [seawater metagenome]|uniref:Uncharacterized protein n=1 Tax=seawater metagenome TaxID=1561972 RepID=A0A5E8CLH0_9ZZZZ